MDESSEDGMARKTKVSLIDDLDGSEASTTVPFGLDGVSYEIDLNDLHAEELRSHLAPWTTAGRRVGGRRRRDSSSAEEARKIRKWALENDIEVPARGRVSAAVREAYATAH